MLPKTNSTRYLQKNWYILSRKECSAGIYAYLQKNIYGCGSPADRIKKVSKAIDVSSDSFRQWVSTADKKSLERGNISKWMPIIKEFTWKDVKKVFLPEWCNQWKDIDSATNIDEDTLNTFKDAAAPNATVFLTRLDEKARYKCRFRLQS